MHGVPHGVFLRRRVAGGEVDNKGDGCIHRGAFEGEAGGLGGGEWGSGWGGWGGGAGEEEGEDEGKGKKRAEVV